MGTILASAIISQCQELAQDEDGDIWTNPQALAWLNEAQRAICVVRPDACVSRGAVQLTPGIRQTITGRRLMAVHYNLGSNGATIGAPVRLVERGIKDESDPGWTTETAATAINEYMYDERNPTQYDVSPPAHASTAVYVELTQAINPAEVADTGDPITLDDAYEPAIKEWMLYRFFGRDSEETPNHTRALGYAQSFFNLLGQKFRMDLLTSPHLRGHLEKGKRP